MDFHSRLKEEIEFADMRYKELAEKSGVPERALYNYVASKKPSMPPADVAVKIANALGVTVEYLVTGKDSKPAIKQKNLNNAKLCRIAEILNLSENFPSLSSRDKKLIAGFVQLLKEF